jgi:hypothetical protein
MNLKRALQIGLPVFAAAAVAAGAIALARPGSACDGAKAQGVRYEQTQASGCTAHAEGAQAESGCPGLRAMQASASGRGMHGAAGQVSCGAHMISTSGCVFRTASLTTTAGSTSAGACGSKSIKGASASGAGCAAKAMQASASGRAGKAVAASASCCAGKATQASAHSCPAAMSHASACTAARAKGASTTTASGFDFTLPPNVTYTVNEVPGGVDFVFTGKGLAQFEGSGCGPAWCCVKESCGNKMSFTHGKDFAVFSIRGDTAAQCCGAHLREALDGAVTASRETAEEVAPTKG